MYRVVEALSHADAVAIITADHGNAEVNFDTTENVPHTAHTLNKVPCIITKQHVHLKNDGDLTWLAPTVLHLLDIPKPQTMTGQTLYL
jgi:2,3-bisphosphoglycerate-independent phosphoglycerate mutase